MSENRQPGFWKRLGLAIVKTFFFVLIVGGIGVGAYFGFRELRRSFDAMANRIDANEQTVALIRSDVNNIMGENPEEQSRQVVDLNDDLASLGQNVTDLQEVLSNDLLAQQAALDSLSQDVAAVTSGNGSLSNDVAALNSGLTALQGDITENGRHIDELGGDLDNVQTTVDTLDASVAILNTEQTSLQASLAEQDSVSEDLDLPQTLGLFRVWELITRARLRLLENNVGLAMEDIETAVRTIDALVVADPEAEGLKMVQARLALAFIGLPDNPATAATDLEAAWDELDIIFAEIFADEEVGEVGVVETETESTEEDAPVATPTPSP